MHKRGGKVFSVVDCFGKEVVLYKSTLINHILPLHPEQFLIEKIKTTLSNPDIVQQDKYGGLRYYSRLSVAERGYFGEEYKYQIVVCKDTDKGRIIVTTYFVKDIKKGGIKIWHK